MRFNYKRESRFWRNLFSEIWFFRRESLKFFTHRKILLKGQKMKKLIFLKLLVIVCFSVSISAQIPIQTLVQISRAEDELRFDKTLEDLMKNPDAEIRRRAALAAGRIGNEAAIPALADLLENDKELNVRAMAAFALGEIESIKGDGGDFESFEMIQEAIRKFAPAPSKRPERSRRQMPKMKNQKRSAKRF